MKEEHIRYFPGVYEFEFPYLNIGPIQKNKNDDNIPEYEKQMIVPKCSVTIQVGNPKDLEQGYFATVTIIDSETQPHTSVTNCFEYIATNIFRLFFQSGIRLAYGLKPEDIRWIEIYPPSVLNENEIRKEVIMKWDEKEKCYYAPEWRNLNT